MKTALITGVTGQDGSYLLDLLLEKGYFVVGIARRVSVDNLERVRGHLLNASFSLVEGDVSDSTFISKLFFDRCFDEVYHLAAQSFVPYSFENPQETFRVNTVGTMNLLGCVLQQKTCYPGKLISFYNACTSEMFGKVQKIPQDEETMFYPRSPYGVSKLASYWLTKNYREAYSLFACNGILFNHESPRRGSQFVTQKIVQTLGKIRFRTAEDSSGRLVPQTLYLGNLGAERDWGHAKDYVRGMWQMLQADDPDDYVLATGTKRSVGEFLSCACHYFGMDLISSGHGLGWQGELRLEGKTVGFVSIDPKFFRPAEVDVLIGDSLKAEEQLGWVREYEFTDLVKEMVDEETKTYR